MASAILASRNEPCWGERKVYMRKYTNSNNPHLKFKPNPNPNPNPSPNPVRQIHDPTSNNHGWHSEEPPMPVAPAAASDDSSSLNRKTVNLNDPKESSHGRYVTFNLSAYTRRELKELKKRLISELEQVRGLRNRIESREFESRSGYPASQFSGSYGGRDATSVARPPPLQLNYALDSPSAAAPSKRTPKANQYYPSSDFLIGKNKITPSEKKKLSGTKRPVSVISGRDPKRPMVEPVMEKLLTSMMRRCGQILTKLMKHKLGWVFNTPVDALKLGLHDYHKIIKHPMDLGTVKAKLENSAYSRPLDFAADVRLTFNNAMLYNPKGQDVYFMAEQLISFFDEMFNPAYKRFEDEHRRMLAAGDVRQRQKSWAPSPAPPPVVESVRRPDPMPLAKKSDTMRAQATFSTPPPVQMQPALTPTQMPAPSLKPRLTAGKLPKPKAKDPNKRQMSYEEKAKLGMSLQNLPPEKMDQLLLIIKKRNEHLAQDGDEIELDIEAVDTETLWELDRFVSNYKKMASKVKRQGLISNQTQISKSPVSETPEAAHKNKKGETGEEDVDIGDEIPMNNYPPVEIEKDAANASSRSSSSSSSSSSSGSSSSSDSDSGSSSGSDSDADSVQSPYVELKAAPET